MKDDEAASIDFKKYWGILRKWRYLSLTIGLAVVSLFTWGSFFMKDTYQAKATIHVQRNVAIAPLVRSVTGNAQDDMLRNIRESITSTQIIEPVVRRVNSSSERVIPPHTLEGMVEGLRKSLEVTARTPHRPEGADYYEVSLKGADPGKITDIVNATVDEFIRQNIEGRRSDASSAYAFIEKQLNEHKAKMEESDRRIKMTGRGVAFSDPVRIQAATEAQTQLNALNNQLAALTAKYTDQHPDVLRVKSEIEDLKKRMPKGGTIVALPQAGQSQGPLGEIERERLVNQRIYEDLQIKLENARIARDLEVNDKKANLKVAEPAIVPDGPIKPIRLVMILAGIVFGLVAAGGAALVMEYFNKSFKNEDEVVHALGVPVVAVIPQMTDPAEAAAVAQRDRRVFLATAGYLAVIAFVFFREVFMKLLGIKII